LGRESNNSRDLSITVSDFIQDQRLSGQCIRVIHKDFGVLFACVINAQGVIITPFQDEMTFEFTPKQILAELAKYGFYITYEPNKNLPGSQLDFLMEINRLGFDKLRILNVWNTVNGLKQFKHYIVAFMTKHKKDWLNNSYSPSEGEFLEALRDGSAMNISGLSAAKRWNWSWLAEFVANINDVLADNAGSGVS